MDKPAGVIFDIQRFSLHDGPGIRTTVFFKGCPLGCLWCANPESQDSAPCLLVRDANCHKWSACEKACPENAIKLITGDGREINWALCTHCLECVDACVHGALTACGREMQVADVLEEVLRDRAFYENSSGGVTISGGEPLFQPEFLLALLRGLKDEQLHTALDTSGFAAWAYLEAVLPLVDLLLYDIKHLDSHVHQETTGARNERILDNLRKAAPRSRIWLRVPVISGFNDSEEHIERLIRLAKEVGAEKISLLPYHEGGKAKSRQTGGVYEFDGSRPPDDDVRRLQGFIEQRGVAATIGN
jgi:pyruvate formate lyase activating enzyme